MTDTPEEALSGPPSSSLPAASAGRPAEGWALPWRDRPPIDGALFTLLASALLLVPYITPSQTAYYLSLPLWAIAVWRRGGLGLPEGWPVARAALPFAVWSLVAALSSHAPWAALGDSRELALLLILPIGASVMRRPRDAHLLVALLVFTATVTALLGFAQLAQRGGPELNDRIRANLSHYMTFSGILMLAAALLVPRLRWPRRLADVGPWALVTLLTLAIAASLTRSSLLGVGAAVGVVIAVRRPRWLAALPVLGLVVLVAVPGLGDRALRMVRGDLELGDVHRLYMYEAGWEMVSAHPFTGIGPGRVEDRFLEFDRSGFAWDAIHSHLHNTAIQLAATRGTIGLAAWIAFVAVFLIDAVRRWRRAEGDEADLVLGSIAAVAAFLVAGLFEYNWGDSEIQLALLSVLLLPSVVGRTERAP